MTGGPFSLLRLAEMSGYRCGICTGPIELDGRGEFSPSIDHILPTSCGGSNDITNLQLTHQGCNILKRDRIGFTRPPIGSEAERPLTLF
jgi:5-methylcytosine-specific restriction endonuclease McrA